MVQSPSSRHIAILCNPLAGAGRAVDLAKELGDMLVQKEVKHTLHIQNWPAALHSVSDVWIVGGDGTINYFINHYPGVKLPLSVFKGGTGNDFHWLLYGNRSMDEQLHLALHGEPQPVDLGKCNDRFFINGVGIGFEGEVARALTGKKKRPGQTTFMHTVIRKIFSYRSKQYAIRSDAFEGKGKMLLIDICNGRRAGGGFHIAPEARADDGYFDVVVTDALSPLQRLRNLPVIEKGKHLDKSFIRSFYAVWISIESDTLIQYHLDGEYHTAEKIEAKIIPGALLFRF